MDGCIHSVEVAYIDMANHSLQKFPQSTISNHSLSCILTVENKAIKSKNPKSGSANLLQLPLSEKYKHF